MWMTIDRRILKEELQPYWPFIDSIAVTDGIALQGRIIILAFWPLMVATAAAHHTPGNREDLAISI